MHEIRSRSRRPLVCVARFLVGLLLASLVLVGCAGPPDIGPSENAGPTSAAANEQTHGPEEERKIVERRGAPTLPDLEVIEATVEARIPERRSLVQFESAPLIRIQQAEQVPSVFVLSVNSDGETDYTELSRIARAYEADAAAVDLSVDAFAVRDGELRIAYSVPLGQAKAIGTFRVFSLSVDGPHPIVAAIEVYTTAGTESRWALFAPDTKPSRFEVSSTGRMDSTLEDINGDGMGDVITRRRETEAGLGFETYLTLYQWNGAEMVETDVMTVVRTLNRFLNRATDHLESKRWARFVDLVTTAEDRERFAGTGLSPAEIVRVLLRVQETQGTVADPYAFLEPEVGIAQIFFPPILENPFAKANRFRHDFRIAAETGAGFIVSVLVEMSENPFVEPVFTLARWD